MLEAMCGLTRVALFGVCLFASQSQFATAELSENPLVHFLFKIFGQTESSSNNSLTRQPLKVFSAGLSRSGTMSVRAAMIELGYKPWHGQELSGRTTEAISHALFTGDASRFLDILQSQGYNSSVELMLLPIAREALVRYPDARVVLTVRDSAEKWAASMAGVEHVTRHMHFGPVGLSLRLLGVYEPMVTMACALHATTLGATPEDVAQECGPARATSSRWQQYFDSDVDSLEVQFMLAEMYKTYNSAVRALVPPEQLLEFNVKEGYGPLCRFLDIPDARCPATFPWANEAAEMRTLGKVVFVLRYGWWAPVVFMLFLLWRSFARKAEKLE